MNPRVTYMGTAVPFPIMYLQSSEARYWNIRLFTVKSSDGRITVIRLSVLNRLHRSDPIIATLTPLFFVAMGK